MANVLQVQKMTRESSFRQMFVDMTLRADQVEFIHFLLRTERERILRESPSALENCAPGSWIEQIDNLFNLFTDIRESNIRPGQ